MTIDLGSEPSIPEIPAAAAALRATPDSQAAAAVLAAPQNSDTRQRSGCIENSVMTIDLGSEPSIPEIPAAAAALRATPDSQPAAAVLAAPQNSDTRRQS